MQNGRQMVAGAQILEIPLILGVRLGAHEGRPTPGPGVRAAPFPGVEFIISFHPEPPLPTWGSGWVPFKGTQPDPAQSFSVGLRFKQV